MLSFTAPPDEPWLTSRPLQLGALPSAPSCARQVSRLQLAGWGLSALCEVADLIVSELVTNAVAACRRDVACPGEGQVAFRMAVSGKRVRIEVWDTSPRHPQMTSDVSPLDESGRGLHLVDALTKGRWGSQPCPAGGKVVWAVIAP